MAEQVLFSAAGTKFRAAEAKVAGAVSAEVAKLTPVNPKRALLLGAGIGAGGTFVLALIVVGALMLFGVLVRNPGPGPEPTPPGGIEAEFAAAAHREVEAMPANRALSWAAGKSDLREKKLVSALTKVGKTFEERLTHSYGQHINPLFERIAKPGTPEKDLTDEQWEMYAAAFAGLERGSVGK